MLRYATFITGEKIIISTVEPPNKGHVGDNINSAVVFFVESLSSFKMY